ncbi:MAG TPA: hypothetical protein VFP28_02330 [Gemmatimonadales bacterium]|nr:hypothetical protein [Gemmatimonadales bacterium]
MFSTASRQLLIAVLIAAAGGCRTVKNQIKALTGGDTTGTATASGNNTVNGPHPKSWGVIEGSPPVLDQTFRVRHDPSELNPGRRLHMPTLDWQQHGDRSGGAFSDGSGTRHQRGS